MKTPLNTEEHTMSDEQTTLGQLRQKGRGRKVFWAIMALGAALVLLGVTPGFSRHDEQRHSGSRHSLEALREALSEDSIWLRHLDLSDEQRRKIGDILEDLGPSFDQFQSDKGELSNRFADLLLAESIDPSEVETTRAEARGIARRVVDETIDAAVAVAEVLTPEQRAELVAHWRQR